MDSASHGMCLNGGGGVKFHFCLVTANNVISMEDIENSFVTSTGKLYLSKIYSSLFDRIARAGAKAPGILKSMGKIQICGAEEKKGSKKAPVSKKSDATKQVPAKKEAKPAKPAVEKKTAVEKKPAAEKKAAAPVKRPRRKQAR